MKFSTMAIIRIAVAAGLMWFVYWETGWATTLCLALVFAADEMRGAIEREGRK